MPVSNIYFHYCRYSIFPSLTYYVESLEVYINIAINMMWCLQSPFKITIDKNVPSCFFLVNVFGLFNVMLFSLCVSTQIYIYLRIWYFFKKHNFLVLNRLWKTLWQYFPFLETGLQSFWDKIIRWQRQT